MSEDIRTSLARIEGRIEGVEEDTKRLVRILDGNGHPGILIRVDRAERDVGDVRESIRWRDRAVLGALIVAAVAVALQVIRWLPKP